MNRPYTPEQLIQIVRKVIHDTKDCEDRLANDEVVISHGMLVAHHRMEKAERKAEKYAALLRASQNLRPILLKQYGAVPECVLDYCNKARSALSKARAANTASSSSHHDA